LVWCEYLGSADRIVFLTAIPQGQLGDARMSTEQVGGCGVSTLTSVEVSLLLRLIQDGGVEGHVFISSWESTKIEIGC